MTTIIDVAQKAGVSFKTVSRVLNGEPGVREKTKAKVLEAAKALDYLRSRSPSLVCLMFDNPSRTYAHDLQLGAMTGCQETGFSLILQSDVSDEALGKLAKRNGLLGVIIGAPQADIPHVIGELERQNVPLVRIATQLGIGDTHHISVDERSAARDAVDHLLDLGHTHIGIINGPPNQFTASLRYEGYCDAMQARDLKVEPRFTEKGNFDFESGMAVAERYLGQSDRPTAIFAANDDMASGALAAAYRLGIRVPDELSIVGFDDSPTAAVIYPSLTTIRQSTADMAKLGVQLLDRIRRGDAPDTRQHIMGHELIVRGSSGPPPVT
jgi:LacI family transcriptional regulator